MQLPENDYRTMVRDKLQDFPITCRFELGLTVRKLKGVLAGRRLSLKQTALGGKLKVIRDLFWAPDAYLPHHPEWKAPFQKIVREEIEGTICRLDKIFRESRNRGRKRKVSRELSSLVDATKMQKCMRRNLQERTRFLPTHRSSPDSEDELERLQLKEDLRPYRVTLETIYNSSNSALRILRTRFQLADFGLPFAQSKTMDKEKLHALRDDIYREEGYRQVNIENATLLILKKRVVTVAKLLEMDPGDRRILLKHAFPVVTLLSQPRATVTFPWISDQPEQKRKEIFKKGDPLSALTRGRAEEVELLLGVEQPERQMFYASANHLGRLFSMQSYCPNLSTLLQMEKEDRAWWISSAQTLCQLRTATHVNLNALFEKRLERELVARKTEYIKAYEGGKISVECFLRGSSL